MRKQELPKWFTGSLQTEGLIVENPISKEEYELNNVEFSMYDFLRGNVSEDDYNRGISWFKTNNAEAFMALLN